MRWWAVTQGIARFNPGLGSVAPAGPGENSVGLKFYRSRHVQRGLSLHRQKGQDTYREPLPTASSGLMDILSPGHGCRERPRKRLTFRRLRP